MKISVAIVTARRLEDTSYEQWREIRNRFLARKLSDPHLVGEFGAMLAAMYDGKVDHHSDYQMRLLSKGTRRPDEVVVVDRLGPRYAPLRWEDDAEELAFPVRQLQPQVGAAELASDPACVAAPFSDSCLRSNKVSYGCSDKNTALLACKGDVIVMLDDCCLPSFGLIEAVQQAFEGDVWTKTLNDKVILLIGHRKVYAPPEAGGGVTVADANWADEPTVGNVATAQTWRRVFGIFAAPVETLLAVNGFNVDLDGGRGGLDEELLCRMDRYAATKEISYAMHPAARVYEIEHAMPWANPEVDNKDWASICPAGWRAPGPDLAARRKVFQTMLAAEDAADEAEEADAEEDEYLDE